MDDTPEDLTLSPLAMASVDDLIKEIQSRNAASVVLLMNSKNNDSIGRFYHDGGYYTCIGLAQSFSRGMTDGTLEKADSGDFGDEE